MNSIILWGGAGYAQGFRVRGDIWSVPGFLGRLGDTWYGRGGSTIFYYLAIKLEELCSSSLTQKLILSNIEKAQSEEQTRSTTRQSFFAKQEQNISDDSEFRSPRQ